VLLLDSVAEGYLSEIFLSFQGEGLHAGRRHLFLRMSGCHLRCRYCDTPESLERSTTFRVHLPDGEVFEGKNPLTCGDVRGHALALIEGANGADGLAVTGGEPLLQADFLAELLADPRWPRPKMLETSGTLPAKLATVLPVVDVVSMDIKLPSNTGEPPLWDVHRQCLSIARGKIYVKVLVDDTTAPDEVERAADLVRCVAPGVAVFLQPITDPSGRVSIGAAHLDRFFSITRGYVSDVRVLPQTHKMLGVH
jgi:organic radical activating enzyme